jgi:hypothetical protein
MSEMKGKKVLNDDDDESYVDDVDANLVLLFCSVGWCGCLFVGCSLLVADVCVAKYPGRCHIILIYSYFYIYIYRLFFWQMGSPGKGGGSVVLPLFRFCLQWCGAVRMRGGEGEGKGEGIREEGRI